MRVLVTGGAGYIGSTTAARLLAAGHEVVVLDDLSNGHKEAVPAAARLVVGDIADGAALAQALRDGADACVHFAALIEAGESMRTPARFYAANTAKTLLLLERLLDAGVRRFVLSSTAAVYGEPRSVPIVEDDPTDPTNVYGATKLAVEQALAWLARLGHLRYAALRYFNASGATAERGEDHDPETHLIPLVLAAAAGRRAAISVFGTDYPTRDGTAVRDYVHVDDLADAHVRALAALDRHERLICNLGNGRGFTVREVIAAAERVTGLPVLAQDAPRREGDPAVLVASSERARELLGWVPSHPDLETIVRSAWEWHARRWGIVTEAWNPLPRSDVDPDRARVYEHGWQSWSPTTSYRLDQRPWRAANDHQPRAELPLAGPCPRRGVPGRGSAGRRPGRRRAGAGGGGRRRSSGRAVDPRGAPRLHAGRRRRRARRAA